MYFSRATIIRDFHYLNSIRDREILKVDFLKRVRPFSVFFVVFCFCVFGYFLSSVFIAHAQYMLAKVMVGHSRTIDARSTENVYFSRASNIRDFRNLDPIREKYIFHLDVLPFSCLFGVFSGNIFILCLLSSLIYAHSRTIRARENVG